MTYMNRIQKAVAKGNLKLDGFHNVQVLHDDWCGVYKNADCNCDPDIHVMTENGVATIKKNGALDYARKQ